MGLHLSHSNPHHPIHSQNYCFHHHKCYHQSNFSPDKFFHLLIPKYWRHQEQIFCFYFQEQEIFWLTVVVLGFSDSVDRNITTIIETIVIKIRRPNMTKAIVNDFINQQRCNYFIDYKNVYCAQLQVFQNNEHLFHYKLIKQRCSIKLLFKGTNTL